MRRRLSRNNHQKGFSTLELAIVLSIVAVLSAMAFPYWEEILTTYRRNTATCILVSDLRLARFEAVKRNEAVRVRLVDSNRYILEREAGGNWEALRPAVDFSERYWTRGASVSGDPNPAVFYSSGRVEEAVTFSVFIDGETPKQIMVSLSGMVRQE